MRNLLNFIIKYSYTLAFILLEVICFAFIFSSNGYRRSSFLNSSNRITASIQEQWSSVTDYTRLSVINDSLVAENEKLRNNLERYRRDDIPSIERSGYEYIAAKVVSATVNRKQNYITINKGREHGVEPEMGVIGADGVVGIVVSVSDKYASVLPIINPESRISVKLERNNYFGSLSWQSNRINHALLSEIPGYVSIKEGDRIVTSGYSAIFPDAVPVGKIHSFTKDASTDFYEITVALFTDFNNLSYVYVIKNLNIKEQRQMMPEDNEDDQE
jgi:rod shape-determining protein MreC